MQLTSQNKSKYYEFFTGVSFKMPMIICDDEMVEVRKGKSCSTLKEGTLVVVSYGPGPGSAFMTLTDGVGVFHDDALSIAKVGIVLETYSACIKTRRRNLHGYNEYAWEWTRSAGGYYLDSSSEACPSVELGQNTYGDTAGTYSLTVGSSYTTDSTLSNQECKTQNELHNMAIERQRSMNAAFAYENFAIECVSVAFGKDIIECVESILSPV